MRRGWQLLVRPLQPRRGVTEVWIDGVKMVAKERSKKWGRPGRGFRAPARGLHRVEVFQTAVGTGPYR